MHSILFSNNQISLTKNKKYPARHNKHKFVILNLYQ